MSEVSESFKSKENEVVLFLHNIIFLNNFESTLLQFNQNVYCVTYVYLKL